MQLVSYGPFLFLFEKNYVFVDEYLFGHATIVALRMQLGRIYLKILVRINK